MDIKKIWQGIKFVTKNKKQLSALKKEVLDVHEAIKKAGKDKKYTKAELLVILKEADEVLKPVIKMLEEVK